MVSLRSCFEIIALVIYTTFPAIFTFLIGHKFNQDGGRLRTVSRGVDNLGKALDILKKLQ